MSSLMNCPAAPDSGISASLGQAGKPPEDSSASGGLVRRRRIKVFTVSPEIKIQDPE